MPYTDPERVKKWHEANPARVKEIKRKYKWKTKYGLTPEEYSERLDAQNNLCGLCREPFVGTANNSKNGLDPVLDHSHSTGKLRLFVHRKCNTGLGCFNDDPELLKRAAQYLENFLE
jgi:hypothetical protein